MQNRAAIAAALILTIAAGAAWMTRADRPPSPAATPDAPLGGPSAGTSPTASLAERALHLAGVGEVERALVEAGVAPADAAAAARAVATGLKGTGELHAIIVFDPASHALRRFQASLIDGSGVVVDRKADGTFGTATLVADVTRRIRVLRGEIDSQSFYSSAVSAGLVDALVPEFINAFAYDFNLAAEVAPGDVFEVAFEQGVNGRGEAVGAPRLLYAELTTPQKSLALYRFVDAAGEAGWYDGNGASTKRGLMRTPVDGARITSGFGMRFHPVLHYNKLHKGTDFAAPVGTPIFAAADAVVEFAAMKGPNGNLTILRHDNGWETYYLHQSAFAPGIAAGARVTQGQHIGDIGTTGRSTGPHLHYEVHVDGEPVDPLDVKTDDAKRARLEGAAMEGFLKERDRIDVARAHGTF